MRIEQKPWEVVVSFEPRDWNRNAREAITMLKELKAKYYPSTYEWHLLKSRAGEFLDWVYSHEDHQNRVNADDYDVTEFTKQFRDLP